HKDKDPHIVAACATAMRSHARLVPYEGYESLNGHVVDIVGTGGDGHDTYNVSTTASVVAAGAGAKVAKHGNRAASSKSGSADLMEAHGCHIALVEPEQVAGILDRTNFCFLFSQTYHPAMKHVASLRKEIAVPTVFNLLGPMSNPAKPGRVVVGVHSPEIGSLMANALKLTGVQEALVVCGTEKLDEISPAGETNYWRIHPSGEITTGTLHPTRDFGLPTHPLNQVKGGDCHENADILKRLLDNELEENHPILDFVLLNAAALLVVAGIAQDFKEGVQKAKESIRSGNARHVLDSFRQETCNQ
ncbi:anthranilate phosphoribosyltransferase, partial [Rhizopus stolonifer]